MALLNFFSKSKVNSEIGKSNKIASSITQIFTHKKLDSDILEELEELLILSDVGAETSIRIIKNFKDKKFHKNITAEEVKQFFSEELTRILEPCQKALEIHHETKPYVIIFNGVNGAGKTTTIGKVAFNLKNQNKKVTIAACDTFRAAASKQLEVWAQRSESEIVAAIKNGEDPAAVAYRALEIAKKNNSDFLLIDTAGRLQNKQNLMDELKKIGSILKKHDINAPHENLLILDATTGQNAKNQLEVFNQIVGITGLVITKLDGTAKGGIVVALSDLFKKPIYAIGIGEKIEDLQEFNAKNFVDGLLEI
ncbi:MAG: signal recognition particle-docking protein FtsY [Pelagibacterales bacterium]|nr:signal recognition particle-docking protein FtsY [Pelagibacterales bacterium]